MARFSPRLSCPERTNKYYNAPNPFETSTAWSMWNGGNCTAYAWGRFHEVMGGSVTDESGYRLPTGNAGDWYDNVVGYKKGSTPALGAVCCWRRGFGSTGWGHVAIVEAIDSRTGEVTFSESGWQAYTFQVDKASPPYYGSASAGFQGFIYPNGISGSVSTFVNAPEVYLTEARKHIGPQGHAWVKSMTNIGEAAWCAATICAIAKAVGFAGKCLPPPQWGYYCVNQVAEYAVNKGGTYILGPRKGSTPKPQPGDLILFDWNQRYTTKYGADHIGVVEKVVGDVVHTIEGNSSNSYRRKQYNYESKVITYYIRPNWELVGGTMLLNGMLQPLYTTKSTRADAMIRDVAYMSTKPEVVVSKTNTGVSAVNYPWLLGPLVDYFGGIAGGSSGSGNVDTSGITNTTARGVADYLLSKGLNRAATAGVMGNIYAESGFKLDAVEMGPPYEGRGLCQWSFSRREKLLRQVSDWKHNLKGQMDFLWAELETSYTSVLKTLQSVPDTEVGCYEACKMFVMRFEVPAGYNTQATWDRRYSYAKPYYDKMKIIPTTTTSSSSASLDGRSPKTTVNIPNSVKQTGIVANFTYYPGFNWAYNQGKVFSSWKAAGSKSANSIATLDGHYLVAMSTKFGSVGDLLKVVLEDGTAISAIIGDSKGSDATSQWGHVLGGGVDIIEWECTSTKPTNRGKQDDLIAGLKSMRIYGKKVKLVYNYGNYAR